MPTNGNETEVKHSITKRQRQRRCQRYNKTEKAQNTLVAATAADTMTEKKYLTFSEM